MKKIFCTLSMLLLLTGCIKAIEQATGIEVSKAVNPAMELEMDLVFLDEIAAMTKLNQLLLERMPVSMEDPWPEMLNQYSQDPRKGEQAARKKYDECLLTLLKNDFYFFRFYNPALYFSYVGPDGVNALLARAIIAARGTLIIEAAKTMGKRYEHAKGVLGYYPIGCKCPYYTASFPTLRQGSAECRRMTIKRGCAFFNIPTEEMLNQYLFEKNGLKSWVDLRVPIDCLRVVEGEHLGTFKEVFYTLLPDHVRDTMEKVDTEVEIVVADLKEVQARLEEKDLPPGQRAALEKREDELEEEVEDKITIQQKLYKEATSTVEVTPEKVRTAKKLLSIVAFIDDSFSQVSAAMTALTVKLVDDMMILAEFSTNQIANSIGYLAAQGIASGPGARKRASILARRFATLPVNYAQIWGHAISQKDRIGIYLNYLEALAAMEKKLKKARPIE